MESILIRWRPKRLRGTGPGLGAPTGVLPQAEKVIHTRCKRPCALVMKASCVGRVTSFRSGGEAQTCRNGCAHIFSCTAFGKAFAPRQSKALTCNSACRRKAYRDRQRRAEQPPAPTSVVPRAASVTENHQWRGIDMKHEAFSPSAISSMRRPARKSSAWRSSRATITIFG
jgi:hypothetical protein